MAGIASRRGKGGRVRCSSCEVLLDQFVEGTLPARRMAAVSLHVGSCASCQRLLTELRVVDALLATTKSVELAPNFTFAVMAEARATVPATLRRRTPWPALAFYLVVAWAAAIAAYAFGSLGPLRAVLAPLSAATTGALGAISGVAHGFGPAAPFAMSAGIAVLVVDLLLAAAFVAIYHNVRPRVAARLQRTEAP